MISPYVWKHQYIDWSHHLEIGAIPTYGLHYREPIMCLCCWALWKLLYYPNKLNITAEAIGFGIYTCTHCSRAHRVHVLWNSSYTNEADIICLNGFHILNHTTIISLYKLACVETIYTYMWSYWNEYRKTIIIILWLGKYLPTVDLWNH